MTGIDKQKAFRILLNKRYSTRAQDSNNAYKGNYPLTAFQEDIWLASSYQRDSSSYNVPIGLRISGECDSEKLRKSIEWVIRRHSIMRSTFHFHQGKPIQRIRECSELELSVVDFDNSRIPEAYIFGWINRFAARPFDLSTGPLYRPVLLRLVHGIQVLIIVVHHIVFDGWSVDILLNDLLSHYRNLSVQSNTDSQTMSYQYVDYAIEQSRSNDVTFAGREADVYMEYLSGLLGNKDVLLPADNERARVDEYPCERVPLTLSGTVIGQLKSAHRKESTTLFMQLIALLNLLLYSFAGRNGVRISSPISARRRPEHMNTIGCFVNMLLFVFPVNERQTLREYIENCRRIVLAALAAKDQPINRVLRKNRLARNTDMQSMYRVMLSYQDTETRDYKLGGIDVEQFILHSKYTKCDISLLLNYDGTSVSGALEYRKDIFNRQTARRLVSDYIAIVAGAANDIDIPVSEFVRKCKLQTSMPKSGLEDAPEDLALKMLRHHLKPE